MKKILIILSVLLLAEFFNACTKSDKEIEGDYLSDFIEKIDLNDTIKWVVILPGLGCTGCIQTAESFMDEYVFHEDILFVLTQTKSIKILENKLNLKLKDYNNIIIDKGDKYLLPTQNVIYPCIIRVENGKLLNHEFQSPMNEGFSNMEKEIKLQGL